MRRAHLAERRERLCGGPVPGEGPAPASAAAPMRSRSAGSATSAATRSASSRGRRGRACRSPRSSTDSGSPPRRAPRLGVSHAADLHHRRGTSPPPTRRSRGLIHNLFEAARACAPRSPKPCIRRAVVQAAGRDVSFHFIPEVAVAGDVEALASAFASSTSSTSSTLVALDRPRSSRVGWRALDGGPNASGSTPIAHVDSARRDPSPTISSRHVIGDGEEARVAGEVAQGHRLEPGGRDPPRVRPSPRT